MNKETIVTSAFRIHHSSFKVQLFARCGLAGQPFDHPAGFSDGICGPLQGCIPGVSKLFFNSLLGIAVSGERKRRDWLDDRAGSAGFRRMNSSAHFVDGSC